MKKQSTTSEKLSLTKITISRLYEPSFLNKKSDFTDTSMTVSTYHCAGVMM